MKRILFKEERTREWAHAFLRIMFGVLLLPNGWDMLVNFSTYAASFTDPLGIGARASLTLVILSELLCSALVAIGLFTRLNAIPIIITFLVAAFIAHAKDPYTVKQTALLYVVLSTYFAIAGGGRYSVDHIIFSSGYKRTQPR